MRLLCTLLYSIVVMLLVMPRPTEAMQAAISSLSEQEEALFLSAVETSNYSLVQQFAHNPLHFLSVYLLAANSAIQIQKMKATVDDGMMKRTFCALYDVRLTKNKRNWSWQLDPVFANHYAGRGRTNIP